MSAPDTTIHWTDPAREQRFGAWLADQATAHGLDPSTVRPASADASFRRYFRVDGSAGSRIVMDAPPQQEDCRPFVHVAGLLGRAGLHVPQVQAWDEGDGFMLLSDLGSTTYLSQLDAAQPLAAGNRRLYGDALDALVRLQSAAGEGAVPAYDEALLTREMQLFPEWYLGRHVGLQLDDGQRGELEKAFALILANNLAQPRGLVHRDYHSRNLMVSAPNPGILDFQDAVFGPLTYDLVSLLRDAYVEWDEEVQIDYAARYWERARKAGLPVAGDFGAFWRDFEWMGLQRQLKVLGIFARLAHRDGKRGYLDDIPRVWAYAHRVCMRYSGLGRLAQLLEAAAGVVRTEGHAFGRL
ncbi:MAG: aminoglycoside phosphotransferase [Aquabacterium sp.]|nr:MAG: aminoglycoside phosphotransferase [Aquabacterium sp.]